MEQIIFQLKKHRNILKFNLFYTLKHLKDNYKKNLLVFRIYFICKQIHLIQNHTELALIRLF